MKNTFFKKNNRLILNSPRNRYDCMGKWVVRIFDNNENDRLDNYKENHLTFVNTLFDKLKLDKKGKDKEYQYLNDKDVADTNSIYGTKLYFTERDQIVPHLSLARYNSPEDAKKIENKFKMAAPGDGRRPISYLNLWNYKDKSKSIKDIKGNNIRGSIGNIYITYKYFDDGDKKFKYLTEIF